MEKLMFTYNNSENIKAIKENDTIYFSSHDLVRIMNCNTTLVNLVDIQYKFTCTMYRGNIKQHIDFLNLTGVYILSMNARKTNPELFEYLHNITLEEKVKSIAPNNETKNEVNIKCGANTIQLNTSTYYLPSELARFVNSTSHKINKALEKMGYYNRKTKHATIAARGYWYFYQNPNGGGQIKWLGSVIPLIQPYL